MAIERKRDGFLISSDKDLLQLDRVHRFLSQEGYWCLDVPRVIVENAAAASLCYGLYSISTVETVQIGYARIVSDFATFAWLCDVYIEKEYRGHGLSKWLIEIIMADPQLENLRRICLATKDAHSLYTKFGFEVTKTPGNWMEIKDNDIYSMMNAEGRV